ncbi:hypothetical protein WAI453_012278 [Rhynchosporium graminicola]
MAAVEGLLFCADRPRNDYGSTTIRPLTIGLARRWNEEDTRIRLNLISRAWIQLRTAAKLEGAYGINLELLPHSESTWPCRTKPHPLKAPKGLGIFGKWPGGIPSPLSDDDSIPSFEPNTDALARKQAHDSPASRITPPSSVVKREDHSLFRDPTMATSVDLQSEAGFKMAAKKKKGKAAAKSAWDDDEDEKKKEEGEGEGGDGGDKSGDLGAGGDGDKKDETSGNADRAGDNPPEDDWDAFTPAKGKKGKKGKKGAAEEIAPPAAEKFDAFHEIKLDDTGPMLDLSFDTGTKPSTGGFGSWGSSWNTGTTSNWDFSATTADAAPAADDKKVTEDNPWSMNRGKPTKKEKKGFSFGSLDEEEEKPAEPDPIVEKKDDDNFDFGFGKKDKKKKKGGAFSFDAEETPESTPAVIEEAAAEDDWGGGWGAPKAKGKKGKKGAAEPETPKVELPKIEEPAPVQDDWSSFATAGKKGKKGKGKTVDEPPKISVSEHHQPSGVSILLSSNACRCSRVELLRLLVLAWIA